MGLNSVRRSPMLISSDLARGLTLRLGFVFLALIVLAILLSQMAKFGASTNQTWPWLIIIVATAFGGLINMKLCRIPGQIHAELLQAEGDPRRWREIRPMIGSGPLVDAWNTIIEQARSQVPIDNQASASRSGETQNALLARAMRSVSAGIAVTDRQFRIVAANGPMSALLGIDDVAEMRDKHFLDVLVSVAKGARDQRTTRSDFERLAGGGNTVTVRLCCGPLMLANGADADSNAMPVTDVEAQTDRVLRINRTHLAGRDGDMDGFAWLVQDITQQVMAAAARDQFLQTATHELRTPLANLRAYAEALAIEDGVSIEEQKEFCNIITDETNRLSRLVDHLLTVGQMEAGSLVINRHSLDPAKIIDEAIEYAKPQVAASRLTLQTDISPKLRKITGDKDKLQAVLVNLIGNAAKYTPEGGNVRIVARLKEDMLEIRVEDSGIGIGPDDLPRIFEKFYRVENDFVRQQAGNGLGLAFAREVARLHQGDITVESQLGEGSVFTLRLPAPDVPGVK